jgi:hypothetical protein
LIIGGLVALSGGAFADQPTEMSSTITLTESVVTDYHVEGGNVFLGLHNTWTFEGDLAGTFETDVSLVFHPDGGATFHEHGTFTGTVGGASGTFELRPTGTGSGTDFSGSFTVLSGTGDLEDLNGHGTFEADLSTGTGSLTASVHFES